MEYFTSFGDYEYNAVAGLGHGASNELHSYEKEYSRRAVRGHFAVSFRLSTAGFHRRDVPAAAIGSRTEPYLNETSKGIPQ